MSEIKEQIVERLASLEAENASLLTKLGAAEYAMNTVAQFVRPRIPSDQSPEQATSFLAWIGTILRLEQRAENAEKREGQAAARSTALEGALRECFVALETAEDHYNRDRFRASSPRLESEVRHLRTSAIRRARLALNATPQDGKGGEE